jgi:hypothetical protein
VNESRLAQHILRTLYILDKYAYGQTALPVSIRQRPSYISVEAILSLRTDSMIYADVIDLMADQLLKEYETMPGVVPLDATQTRFLRAIDSKDGNALGDYITKECPSTSHSATLAIVLIVHLPLHWATVVVSADGTTTL